MAHLPYDILYRIAKELAAPSKVSPYDGRAVFPFNHPALLPSVRVADPDAAKNLRSCALVCRSWSAPASRVNVRHLDIWRASRDAIVSALSRNERYALVHHFQAGRESCPDCSARSTARAANNRPPCTNGVSMQTFLWTLSRCPNIRRVTVHEWLELEASVDYCTYTPFSSITTFRLGTNQDISRRLPLRSFCQLLRLMPSLKRLSFGDLSATDASIDGMPPPDFQLESLAVSDARGIRFASYEWLLAHSSQSLHTFWAYGVFEDPCFAHCIAGIQLCRPAVRTLYLFGCSQRSSPDLGSCAQLEELYIDDAHLLRLLAHFLDPHVNLRRLTTVVTSFSDLYPILEILGNLLAELSDDAFPKLECLSVEAFGYANIVNAPISMEVLDSLRTTCETRGMTFRFPRMVELESDLRAGRPV